MITDFEINFWLITCHSSNEAFLQKDLNTFFVICQSVSSFYKMLYYEIILLTLERINNYSISLKMSQWKNVIYICHLNIHFNRMRKQYNSSISNSIEINENCRTTFFYSFLLQQQSIVHIFRFYCIFMWTFFSIQLQWWKTSQFTYKYK